jgi:hypothetical protein
VQGGVSKIEVTTFCETLKPGSGNKNRMSNVEQGISNTEVEQKKPGSGNKNRMSNVEQGISNTEVEQKES